MIGPVRDIFDHARIDAGPSRPVEPVRRRHLEMNVEHPIDQRRRHLLVERRILRAVSGADNDRTRRQDVFSDAALVDEAVERLLHLVRARVELIEKQTVRFFPGDHRRRIEPRDAVGNLRNADEVLRR